MGISIPTRGIGGAGADTCLPDGRRMADIWCGAKRWQFAKRDTVAHFSLQDVSSVFFLSLLVS